MQYIHKKDGRVAQYLKKLKNNKHLLVTMSGEKLELADSTFKRWWTIDEIKHVLKPVPHHTDKSYCRNDYPLWDAKAIGGKLNFYTSDKTCLMMCYKTDNCFCVVQMTNKARRYFKDPRIVLNHVLNNQDIRTRQAITPVFERWLNEETV